MRVIALAAVAALMASPLFAETEQPAKDPNKIICKSKAKTGTRFPTKTCRTRAEWEQIAEAAKRDAKDVLDQPIINTDRNN